MNSRSGRRSSLGTLDDVVAERLPLLDKHLGKSEVPLSKRPFRATFEFIQLWVERIRDANGREFAPRVSAQIVLDDWFGAIYQAIEAWYFTQYPHINTTESRLLSGFVTLRNTAFELKVPSIVTEPGETTETVWLRFPDRLLPSEDPLSWLTSPPGLNSIAPEEREQLDRSVRLVAERLRSIHAAMMSIPHNHAVVDGLLTALEGHLEQASRKGAAGDHPSLETGCWDLQMVAECALKTLLAIRSGNFTKTHDLTILASGAAPYLPDCPKDALDLLPPWQVSVDRRYGSGSPVTLATYVDLYLSTLELADVVLDSLVELRLGQGKIEVARPPWKRGGSR